MNIRARTGFSCVTCDARIPSLAKMCHRDPFLLIAGSEYTNPVMRACIHALKYERIYSASVPIAQIIMTSLVSVVDEIPFSFSDALFVPIPLASRRIRERGFNQSEYIAKECLRFLPKCEYAPEALIRTRHTESQTKFHSHEDRIAHMNHAFFANRIRVDGKNIILLDDVFTSGGTVRDAVRALREVGAHRILVLTAARA